MRILDDCCLSQIDENWTLFLDRDGVINEKIDGYISSVNEFRFTSGSLEAIAGASQFFRHCVVVTNQQGIAKGLMSMQDLQVVHQYMRKQVEEAGGHFDAIYFCPDLANSGSTNRKPATGMGLRAASQFPDIDLKRTIMIGDSESDIVFGKRLGTCTVLIGTVKQVDSFTEKPHFLFPSLAAFWQAVIQARRTV